MNIEFIKHRKVAPETFELHFQKPPGLKFTAGDYVEIAVDTPQGGSKRWMSIAASPTEENLLFVTKIKPKRSDFKEGLNNLEPGDAAQISPAIGSFNLPHKPDKPLLFLAFGIGVTPFRSMAKFLIDQEQTDRFDIKTVYIASNENDLIYWDILDQIGPIETVLTQNDDDPDQLKPDVLAQLIPDYDQRLIYLSGPQPPVETLYNKLQTYQVAPSQLKLDYFPGYKEI